jgi:hypothetical protein
MSIDDTLVELADIYSAIGVLHCAMPMGLVLQNFAFINIKLDG